MNKNLMAIFHKEFRVGDVVEPLKEFTERGRIVYKHPDNKIMKDYYAVLQNNGVETFVHKSKLTLITPFVSLWEVLEKLRAKHNRFFQVHPNYNIDKTVTIRMYEQKKNIDWLLSDKSGEVPLHRQSKKTQDQIYEVLK